jgi:DNA repair protein RadC
MEQKPTPIENLVCDRLHFYGERAISDMELITLLVGEKGAKQLWNTIGGSTFMLRSMSASEIANVDGITKKKAATLAAALEIGRRHATAVSDRRASMTSAEAAYEHLRQDLQDLPHEEFWVLMMDRGCRLVGKVRVGQGGMHGVVADPKIIFKAALDKRASAIIVAHNHPSGQLRPSEEDIRLTRKLIEGGRMLDIAVHDHIIVAAGGYYSFADNAMMS